LSAERGNIGILHSVLGGSDGVSIVAEQSVEALRGPLGWSRGSIRLLAGEAPGYLGADLDPALSHRAPANLRIRREFSEPPSDGLRAVIESGLARARAAIEGFVRERDISVLIAHNACHPTNFLMSTGLGRYIETALPRPRYVLWWHDSHLERQRYSRPNPVIADYLRYLPGTILDGIVFINSLQPALACAYLARLGTRDPDAFIRDRTVIIPNTCDVSWDWRASSEGCPVPPADPYDADFFEVSGIGPRLRGKGHRLEDACILLQHTRVVARKRIDHAIDFAVALARRPEAAKRPVVLFVSGHAGDERGDTVSELGAHLEARLSGCPACRDRVFLHFAGEYVGPERSGSGSKKVFRFMDLPRIAARQGGLGVFFSEMEGFGNNLLEMISSGLPVVVNRYPVFKKDIEPLGFDLPAADEGRITEALARAGWALLTDAVRRRRAVMRNLGILSDKLNHGVMASALGGLLGRVRP